MKKFDDFNTTKEAVMHVLESIELGCLQDNFYYYMYNSSKEEAEKYRNAIFYVLNEMQEKTLMYINSQFIFDEIKEEAERMED